MSEGDVISFEVVNEGKARHETRDIEQGGRSGWWVPCPNRIRRYSAQMVLRRFVASSTMSKVLCATLLLLFAVLCGLHIAGASHGADPEAVGLATGSGMLLAALLFGLFAFGSKPVERDGEPRRRSTRIGCARRRPRSASLHLGGRDPLLS